MTQQDCHTHPFQAKRSIEGMRDYAETALRKGLKRIVFTEHAPLRPGLYSSGHFLTEREFELYFDCFRQVCGEYAGRLEIIFGAEMDFHPDNLPMVRRLVERYPVAYRLGSLHMHLPFWRARWEGKSREYALGLALAETEKLIRSGLFDTLAHFDFFRFRMEWYEPSMIFDKVRPVFEALAETGVALEINTSGLRKPFASTLPGRELLELTRPYGLNYRLGSDAHAAEFIADAFDEPYFRTL